MAEASHLACLLQAVICGTLHLKARRKDWRIKRERERERKKNYKICGCKEICLECRVRECMTENRGGKLCLCPAPRLARSQNNKSLGDREPDSGRRYWMHTPQKCCLTLAATKTASNPRKHPETPQVISYERAVKCYLRVLDGWNTSRGKYNIVDLPEGRNLAFFSRKTRVI